MNWVEIELRETEKKDKLYTLRKLGLPATTRGGGYAKTHQQLLNLAAWAFFMIDSFQEATISPFRSY